MYITVSNYVSKHCICLCKWRRSWTHDHNTIQEWRCHNEKSLCSELLWMLLNSQEYWTRGDLMSAPDNCLLEICLTMWWLLQTRLPPPPPTSFVSLSSPTTTPRRSIPNLRSSPLTEQQRHRARSLHDSTLLCVPNTMPSSSTTRNGMGKSLLHNKRKSTTDGSAATSSQETFQMLAKNQGDSADFIEIQTIDEVVTQV